MASPTSDVIWCAKVEQFGVNVGVQFGDSSSNGSQDIRLPHFVTNDHDHNDDYDAGVRRSSHRGKTP